MGVERAVTRWYVQRQLILTEISRLEDLQLPSEPESEADIHHPPEATAPTIQQQLEEARRRLKSLGPCPKPMMG